MNQDLKLIIAQQVVIMKKLEKLENKLMPTSRSCPPQTYVDELKEEAMKIFDEIKVKKSS